MIHGLGCRHLGHSLRCFLGGNGNHPEEPTSAAQQPPIASFRIWRRSRRDRQDLIKERYIATILALHSFQGASWMAGCWIGGCVGFATFPANPKAIKDVAVGQGSSGTFATVESWE